VAKQPIKRSQRESLDHELAQLRPWPHWNSEEEHESSESDSDDDSEPRSQIRYYPPRQIGVQNLPWSKMPAELRNTIYEYCMANEEEKVLNVLYCPHGIPRRSIRGVSTPTNFAHSYWGFTQTCLQVRNEFTPWLLEKRKVRTPLATLNNYIHTFHRPDAITGLRIGHVEPICTGAPLTGDGVEVLELLKLQVESPPFHLQLVPTSVSLVLEWLQPEARVGEYDKLNIFRELGQFYEKDLGSHIRKAGLRSINITSVPQEDEESKDGPEYFDSEDIQTGLSDDDDDLPRRILIKLKVNATLSDQVSRDKQILTISRFVYESQLASKAGVEVHTFFAGGDASWKVRKGKVVDMFWRKKRASQTIRRRLTPAFYALHSFKDEAEE
jgi:hypothetical protein